MSAQERYLQYAIAPDAPPIRSARVVHEGFIRTRPNGRWFPVRGTQSFDVVEPGFDWHGVIRPFPLIRIEAHDSLHEGRGRMLVKLNGLITIADVTGPEMDQSSAARWLMEGLWFPSMLASNLVQWEPLSANHARITLRPDVTTTVEVDDQGRIVSVECDRYRDAGGGKAVMTRWHGACEEYQDFGGYRVPATIRGAWMLDGGEFECIRFQVQTIEYR